MKRFTPAELDSLKSNTAISEIIGPYVTWDRKKTRASKGDFWACCPFHGESSPSFHCEDAKGRYYCFGCGAKGDHIKFMTDYLNMSFMDAVKALGGDTTAKPDPQREAEMKAKRDAERAQMQQEKDLSDDERADMAAEIFRRGVPIEGTPAEKYIIGRGIPAQKFSPAKFRYVERLSFGAEPFGNSQGLVGAVTNNNGDIRAIWRIFVNHDGSPVLWDGDKVKIGLGPAGGSAVRLSNKKSSHIAVCEGMETAFGVKALIADKYPVWSALSTSGIIGLELPDWVRTVTIYADGDRARFVKNQRDESKIDLADPPGAIAANSLAQKCKGRGVKAIIETPPDGSDWLDVWNEVKEYAQS